MDTHKLETRVWFAGLNPVHMGSHSGIWISDGRRGLTRIMRAQLDQRFSSHHVREFIDKTQMNKQFTLRAKHDYITFSHSLHPSIPTKSATRPLQHTQLKSIKFLIYS